MATATQTATNNNGRAKAAASAQPTTTKKNAKGAGAPKGNQNAAAPTKAIMIPTPNALSVDIGPQVLSLFSGAAAEQQKQEALVQSLNQKKYSAASMLVQGVLKAAQADSRIDLGAAFSEDTERKTTLFNMLRQALGTHEWVEPDKGKPTLVLTREATRYLPGPKDKADTPEYRRKESVRVNFAASLKMAACAAAGIMDMNAVVTPMPKAGTLMIAGPEVEKLFGKSEVELNGAQKEQEVKARPTLALLRDVAAANRDVKSVNRNASRSGATAASGPSAAASVEAFGSLVNSLITALNSLTGGVTPDHERYLHALESAIAEARKAPAAAQ